MNTLAPYRIDGRARLFQNTFPIISLLQLQLLPFHRSCWPSFELFLSCASSVPCTCTDIHVHSTDTLRPSESAGGWTVPAAFLSGSLGVRCNCAMCVKLAKGWDGALRRGIELMSLSI